MSCPSSPPLLLFDALGLISLDGAEPALIGVADAVAGRALAPLLSQAGHLGVVIADAVAGAGQGGGGGQQGSGSKEDGSDGHGHLLTVSAAQTTSPHLAGIGAGPRFQRRTTYGCDRKREMVRSGRPPWQASPALGDCQPE